MALTTISVGIDPSALAKNALRWARDLSTACGASVRAVGTWRMPLISMLPGPIEGMPTVEVMAQQCSTALDQAVEEIDTDGVITKVVAEGKPGPTLVAESAGADLIVVGRTGHGKRHGISRLAEVVLGSTARHCVHHAPVPVATIPAGATWPGSATVVVGIDGSTASIKAFRWAMGNLPPDTSLHVVRVFAPWVGDGLTPMEMIDDAPLLDSIRHETQRWIDDATKGMTTSIEAEPLVEVFIGRTSDLLQDPGYSPDLIVVGERGQTGVAGMVLGSVADHLIRHATCAVIVVPDSR